MSATTSAAVGGCCSRCGCDGADANDATLRDTRPHRTAWCNAARTMAWIWRIVAGASPRRRSAEYSPSRWPAVSFDSRTRADRRAPAPGRCSGGSCRAWPASGRGPPDGSSTAPSSSATVGSSEPIWPLATSTSSCRSAGLRRPLGRGLHRADHPGVATRGRIDTSRHRQLPRARRPFTHRPHRPHLSRQIRGNGCWRTVARSRVRCSDLDFLVRPLGFEPRTCGLRVRCSAVELEARGRGSVGATRARTAFSRLLGVSEGT